MELFEFVKDWESSMVWPDGAVGDKTYITVTPGLQNTYKIFAALGDLDMWRDKGPNVDRFPGNVRGWI